MADSHVKTHLLGRKPSVDERDQNYPMKLGLESIRHIPANMFWQTGPVQDQGDTGHCVGFTWAQWLMTKPLRTMNGPKGHDIYYMCKVIDGEPGNEDGTYTRSGVRAMQNQGRIANYLWAQSIDDLRVWVLTKGAACLGTNWYEGMFDPDRNGFIYPTGENMGGHEYLCVGYSSKRKAFRFINSWGKYWGQKGRFWMKEADVERLVFEEGGEACGAVERKVII